jgi:hypothetical protein
MIDFIKENYEWFFSGIGVLLLSWVIFFFQKNRKKDTSGKTITASNISSSTIVQAEKVEKVTITNNPSEKNKVKPKLKRNVGVEKVISVKLTGEEGISYDIVVFNNSSQGVLIDEVSITSKFRRITRGFMGETRRKKFNIELSAKSSITTKNSKELTFDSKSFDSDETGWHYSGTGVFKYEIDTMGKSEEGWFCEFLFKTPTILPPNFVGMLRIVINISKSELIENYERGSSPSRAVLGLIEKQSEMKLKFGKLGWVKEEIDFGLLEYVSAKA